MIYNEPEVFIQWLFTGDKKYAEPFFDDTIAFCRRLPQNRHPFKSLSTMDAMVASAKNIDSLPPSAIIFHVSRCGSTLLSQLLSCDPHNKVLSEVPFFDEILRLPFTNKKYTLSISACLQSAVLFYGQKEDALNNRLFIKTDSWHLHFYDQLRDLYPGIPFIILYRHPYDVFLSQKKQRGLQAIPGIVEPGVFNFPKNYNVLDFDIHLVNVLESYYQKCITIMQNDPLAFSFNYEQGIMNIAKEIYAVLNVNANELIIQKWTERSLFHAKRPKEIFEEETSKIGMPSLLDPVFKYYKELNLLNRLNLE